MLHSSNHVFMHCLGVQLFPSRFRSFCLTSPPAVSVVIRPRSPEHPFGRAPRPAAGGARPLRPWGRWGEWGSMARAAWLGFRLYVPLYSPLGGLLFSLGMNPVNTLLFLMLFLAVVLPICLALGSRFGKWLASHLDF